MDNIGAYTCPAAYARDLLITAAPEAYAAEGLAEADAARIAAIPGGIRDLQQWASEQPNLPDAFRQQLRAAAWVPAHHCPDAVHTLRWDPSTLSWTLRRGTDVLDTLPGYPVGQPGVTDTAAHTWADRVLGSPQQWIEKPANSGGWHTHHDPTTTREDHLMSQIEQPAVDELQPGDDLGQNTTPICCGDDMAATDADGHRQYACRSCHTVIDVDQHGLVFDIRRMRPADDAPCTDRQHNPPPATTHNTPSRARSWLTPDRALATLSILAAVAAAIGTGLWIRSAVPDPSTLTKIMQGLGMAAAYLAVTHQFDLARASLHRRNLTRRAAQAAQVGTEGTDR